jgi:teichuronic acid biosynthesis glycosyltransferase TuaH
MVVAGRRRAALPTGHRRAWPGAIQAYLKVSRAFDDATGDPGVHPGDAATAVVAGRGTPEGRNVGTTVDSRQDEAAVTAVPAVGTSLVVCSLEEWGEVRRRIRILVDEFVAMDPDLTVLYVAPAVDIPYELRRGNFSGWAPKAEQAGDRIHVLRPRKWLPRALGPSADRSLGRQVAHAARSLGLDSPLLWVNDAAYAAFAVGTGWPIVYDVTDDWLLAPSTPRQSARLQADDRLLVERSDAVVVCSPDLARSRGECRTVDLIPNGVDVDHFRTPQPRPAELPDGPVLVYVGTLHEERIDIPLLEDLGARLPQVPVVLVGPDSLGAAASARVDAIGSVRRLGPVPYGRVPAFLQHADVVVIPHLVNRFTESLDPIKAYECLAAGRPTVSTPVAGFRDLGEPVVVQDRDGFVDAVVRLVDQAPVPPSAAPPSVASWHERARAMRAVMDRVRSGSGRR